MPFPVSDEGMPQDYWSYLNEAVRRVLEAINADPPQGTVASSADSSGQPGAETAH